jgi:hypothetical protein
LIATRRESNSMTELKGIKQTKDEWQFYTLLIWVATLFVLLWMKWPHIDKMLLVDTDDNLRLAQVRDWIAGQGWYDLRQYRLHPPQGADIHWSRFVDIPMAFIITVLTPVFGKASAETAAIAIGPVLPLSIVFLAMGAIARRTLAPLAWIASAAIVVSATAALQMFMPTRIDHHGWQMATLALVLAGLTDPNSRRSGLTVGLATAASLAIGLEMLPFLAIGGVVLGLRWVGDRSEAVRLSSYGLSLALGTGLAFLIFASNANWGLRCDVLSPVWLSALALAGVLLFGLAKLKIENRILRFSLIAFSGGIVGLLLVTQFPQCLSRPEGISAEADKLWFQNVREVKTLFEQGANTAVMTLMLPLSGLIGALFMIRRDRGDFWHSLWFPIVSLSAVSTGMLLWQSRVSPVAQMLAIPGASALAWYGVLYLRASTNVLVRTLGVVAVFLTVSGLAGFLLVSAFPLEAASERSKAINRAFAQCMDISNLTPLDKLPAATMLTFVDMAPRLIAMTHHRAISGPYHRNFEDIVAVHHAFGGTPDQARAIAKQYGATMVLTCPNLAESTLHKSRSPKGFYADLDTGKIPKWLIPVALPKNSPFRLWQIAP